MIADSDLLEAARSESQFEEQETSEDREALTQKILLGFDPENDRMDRRILYEVTGLTLVKDEFLDDESSDSDEEELDEAVTTTDPLV